MQKVKLRIIEKNMADCQLEEILTVLLLPNTTIISDENHKFLIGPQQKGEKYATRK